jgi:lambda family phage portal protein
MAWRERLPWNRRAARGAWLRATVAAAVESAHGVHARAAFDAAETPHYTDGWRTDEPGINDALAARLATLRARSRGLARNNEWARRYLLQQRANVLGAAGIQLQMRMLLRDGRPNEAVNDRIEAAWWDWGRPGVCEVGARHGWVDVQRIMLDCLARDGEILARHVAQGPHGYALQLLDPAVLDVHQRRDWQGRRVRMGVEIDDAGTPVAYWLQATRPGDDVPGWSVGRHVRVPAQEMLHAYVAEEPGQLRGYPRLTVGAQRLWLLQDFERSAAVASSNAAKRVGFFYTATGEAPAGFGDTVVSAVIEQAKAAGKTLSADELKALEESARRFTTTVPGQYDTLPDGTQFVPNKSDYPHVVYGEYVAECLRGWTAGLGMSHATLGNNLENVNYSSARVGILDEREQYRLDQAFLVEHVHAAVFERWLTRALLTVPALRTLAYDRLPEYLAAATWQPRRWHWIDPAKEAAAAETNLRLRLTSRRRLILERGEDPDEVFAEIEQEEARFGPADSAATPAPPAAPDADDEPAPARARMGR